MKIELQPRRQNNPDCFMDGQIIEKPRNQIDRKKIWGELHRGT